MKRLVIWVYLGLTFLFPTSGVMAVSTITKDVGTASGNLTQAYSVPGTNAITFSSSNSMVLPYTNGILKVNSSGNPVQAVSGVDYAATNGPFPWADITGTPVTYQGYGITNVAPSTTGTSILYGNGLGGFSSVNIGSGVLFSGGTLSATGTGGTITSVSITVPGGFSVSPTTITNAGTFAISTALSGIIKGTGSAFTNAISGTDYAPATSGSSILYGNGSGGFSSVTIGSGVAFTSGTLSATGTGGTVTSVSLTVPNWLSASPVTITNSGTFAITANTSNALPAYNGSALTSLNASSIASGTISTNYLPSIILYTNSPLNASNISSGLVATNYLPTTLLYTNSALNGANLTSSTVPISSFNVTGTASSSTYLRGDGSWASVSNGTVTSVSVTVPNWLSVTPAIITNSGTFAITANTSNALPAYNGSALTNLNGSNIASGVVATNYLPTNVAYLNATNTFTALNTFTNGINVPSYLQIGNPTGFGYALIFNSATNDGTGNGNGDIVWDAANTNRWTMTGGSQNEAGSNTGSNFIISRMNDAGSYLASPIYVYRNTGDILLNSVYPYADLGYAVQVGSTNQVSSMYVSGNLMLGTTTNNGNALQVNGAASFSGGFVATGSGIPIVATQSGFYATTQPTMVYSSGVTNQKIWDQIIYDSNGTLRFRAVNDNEGAANDWLESYRTGDAPTYAAFPHAISVGTNGWDGVSPMYVNGVGTVYAPGNTNVYDGGAGAINSIGDFFCSTAPASSSPGTIILTSPTSNNDAGGPGILIGNAGGAAWGVALYANGSYFTITDPDADGTEFAIYNDEGTGLITDGGFAYDRGSLVVGTNAQDGTTDTLQVHGVERIDVTGASAMLALNDTSGANGAYISLQVNGTEQASLKSDIYSDCSLAAGGSSSLVSTHSSSHITMNYYGRMLVGPNSTGDDGVHTAQIYGSLYVSNAGTYTLSSGAATVSNTNVGTNSVVVSFLKTASGTISAAPYATSVTAGTGFTIHAGASDNSTYNYVIMN